MSPGYVLKGKAYVVGDDIDTDAIIPARYMTNADPSQLGKHAMEDLDPEMYPAPFLGENGSSEYSIIIAGKNFGCGSSREHAPMALHAAGVNVVVARSFARIFYRNSVNGGIVLPLESDEDLSGALRTGASVEVDMNALTITGENGAMHRLKPFGPVKDIIDAGGLTAYNRKMLGLI